MSSFTNIDIDLLNTIAGIESVPGGAINIRKNGIPIIRQSSPNIAITSLEDKPGMKIDIEPGTKGESVHVPVILTADGFQDTVYNTFVVGEDADITIIAGCGINCGGNNDSSHNGIHEIVLHKRARMKYVEKHYGEGEGQGKRMLNPTTIIHIDEGASAELEMAQIKGVDDTIRVTEAHIKERGNLKIIERVMTHDDQKAESDIKIYIEGEQATAQIFSRSVAKDQSCQVFRASIIGRAECLGHVECDAIIMDKAQVHAIPELKAENADAVLTHEASIGKIAGDQLVKLMSLGLTEQEAIDTILDGFLK